MSSDWIPHDGKSLPAPAGTLVQGLRENGEIGPWSRIEGGGIIIRRKGQTWYCLWRWAHYIHLLSPESRLHKRRFIAYRLLKADTTIEMMRKWCENPEGPITQPERDIKRKPAHV